MTCYFSANRMFSFPEMKYWTEFYLCHTQNTDKEDTFYTSTEKYLYFDMLR